MNHKLLLDINGLAGQNHFLDRIMVFCASYLIYVIFVVAAICLGYLLYKRMWRETAYFMATLAVSFMVSRLAGLIYVDHRPFVDYHLTQLIAHATGNSFPSDHTTAVAAIAVGLLYFTRFKRTGAIILVAAILIGFSRIYVGVHYPIDILGGILSAVAGGIIVGIVRLLTEKNDSTQVGADKSDS